MINHYTEKRFINYFTSYIKIKLIKLIKFPQMRII